MRLAPRVRVLMAASLLLCTAEVRGGGPRRPARRAADGIDTTFAFDRRGTVTIENGTEGISVTGWDQSRVRIKSRGAVALQERGPRLTISARPDMGGDERIEVSVPRGVRVVARTRSGDVTVQGTRGNVETHVSDGDVALGEIDSADVHTLSGDVSVSAAAGAIRAETVSGTITATDPRAEVDLSSVTGDLIVKGVVSRRVRAKTTSGDVTFSGSITQDGTYELASHSGDVKITLQHDAGAEVDASTWSGSIDSDFAMTLRPGEVMVQPGEKGKRAVTTKHFTFQIGKGGGHIIVDTFSGDITISSRDKP